MDFYLVNGTTQQAFMKSLATFVSRGFTPMWHSFRITNVATMDPGPGLLFNIFVTKGARAESCGSLRNRAAV